MASEPEAFDLERDHPVTEDDVRVLRALRAQVPSWFSLGARELASLLPREALERRPPTPAAVPPFTLE